MRCIERNSSRDRLLYLWHEGTQLCHEEDEHLFNIENEEPKGDTARTYKQSNGATVHNTFKYTQPFYYHFQYRHQIDDHNGSAIIQYQWRQLGQPSGGLTECLRSC